MAAGSYSTEAFVSAVRLRGMLPATSDGTAFPTDADIISLANQEMVSMLAPWLINAREGYLLQYTTVPLVANQASYSIPSRALAAEFAYAVLVDAQGNPVYPGLVESDLEVAVQYPYTNTFLGQPTRYFFQGNSITFIPTPADSTLSAGIYYAQRPNQLVPSTSVATVTGTSQGSGNFTISYSGGLPTTGTSFTTGVPYEVVHANPGFETVALGNATTVNSTSMIFSGTLPSGINVGDSLCLQDTANYPTFIPADVWTGMFAQWIAYKIAEIRRDKPGMEALGAGYRAAEKSSREYMGRRDKLGHRKISASFSRRWGRPPLYFVK